MEFGSRCELVTARLDFVVRQVVLATTLQGFVEGILRCR